MVGPIEVAGAASAAAFCAWAVRGRSSTVFCPSVWRGPSDRKAIALTFDDGPGRGTEQVLRILEAHGVKATFFQCGAHVRRRPAIVREMKAAGHELGNHTDTHERLWLHSPKFIYDELSRAQMSFVHAADMAPILFRPTYGVRWFGLRKALYHMGLTNIMWTTIALDWALDSARVLRRLERELTPGAIYCLHDARGRDTEADISSTVDALREFLPLVLDQGYECVTVGDLIGYSGR